jgi:hypothetical protein
MIMHAAPEIQFQISLLKIASLGQPEHRSEELEKLLEEQTTVKR